jgi:hypothetical protein
MTTPIGGAPHQPHVSAGAPINKWDEEINNIVANIMNGKSSQAHDSINQLVNAIEGYRPQTSRLAETVSYLEEAKSLLSDGYPSQAMDAMGSALHTLIGT